MECNYHSCLLIENFEMYTLNVPSCVYIESAFKTCSSSSRGDLGVFTRARLKDVHYFNEVDKSNEYLERYDVARIEIEFYYIRVAIFLATADAAVSAWFHRLANKNPQVGAKIKDRHDKVP